jgi:hypothetical protein
MEKIKSVKRLLEGLFIAKFIMLPLFKYSFDLEMSKE